MPLFDFFLPEQVGKIDIWANTEEVIMQGLNFTPMFCPNVYTLKKIRCVM